MIQKFKQNDGRNRLQVTDKNGNVFTMLVGGNTDLFWVPNDYPRVKNYSIDKSDGILFAYFKKLFSDIRQHDRKENHLLKENVFEYVSEDLPEEEANKLRIIENAEQYEIEFVKNEKLPAFSFAGFFKGCVVCFCNSGSRVPDIEILFMKMFNELAYQNEKVAFADKSVKNQNSEREIK